MKLQDLLVVLDGSARSDAVLDVAIGLARRHDAHLTGLCPVDLLFTAYYGPALGGYPQLAALREAADQLSGETLEKAKAIEAKFLARLEQNGVRGAWEVATGAAPAAVARRARTADLLVISQNDPDHPLPPPANHLTVDALMTAGRPVLIIPFAGEFASIGSRVVIGWNGSREAARAAQDSLLLIEPTASVTVLTVEHGSRANRAIPAADLAEHLARHGLKVAAARTFADHSISDGDALLAYAFDSGADLLVIGGYGHSRLREIILGGVSRELLDHMTLPVLMSH
jgi:nucleotide-binding universal stress UspA family protein